MRSFAGRGVLGIAMSGYGSEDDVNQSRAAGFTEHLIKPLDHRQIEETIRRVTAKDE
jgi:hypothetical protein